MRKIFLAAIALVALASLMGCSATPTQPSSSPSASSATENPYGGFPVDPPADDEVVLTVIGKETIEYTMPELEALEQVSATIYEPFVKQTQTFEGVELATLFEAAGIASSEKVSTVALNDYVYDDLASKFTNSKAILALKRDGSIIQMDQGGPVRIVFPNNQDYSDFLNAWNWSLRTIEVVK